MSENRSPLHEQLNLHTIVLGEKIGSGGNNDVFEILGKKNLVARVFRRQWEGNLPMITELKNAHAKIPRYVNIARILQVGTLTDNKVAAIMEKAAGETVHLRRTNYFNWSAKINRLTQIPVEKYKKLVQDNFELFSNGLKIDPSKPDNILLDENNLFTYIDLTIRNESDSAPYSLLVPILDTGAFYNQHRGKLSANDFSNIRIIIDKLRESGDPIEENRVQEILRVAQDL